MHIETDKVNEPRNKYDVLSERVEGGNSGNECILSPMVSLDTGYILYHNHNPGNLPPPSGTLLTVSR